MENLKFILISLIVLIILGFIGYFAIITIEPGNVHVDKQKQKELENKNKELEAEVGKLQSQINVLQASQAKPAPGTTVEVGLEEKPLNTGVTTTSKYQSLMNELQKLIDDKVYMKEKSQGTRVGTIQTFLNIYNKTSKKVDNDYGASTKTAVIAFQKAQGLTADGQTGPTTYKKMIEWLKKQ